MNFNSPVEEASFNRVLIIYIEEFGAEQVTAIFPQTWKGSVDWVKFLPVTFKIWDYPFVGLRVADYSAIYDQEVC